MRMCFSDDMQVVCVLDSDWERTQRQIEIKKMIIRPRDYCKARLRTRKENKCIHIRSTVRSSLGVPEFHQMNN